MVPSFHYIGVAVRGKKPISADQIDPFVAFLVVVRLLIYMPDEQAVLWDIAVVVRAVGAPVFQQEVLVLSQGNFVRLPVAEDFPNLQP